MWHTHCATHPPSSAPLQTGRKLKVRLCYERRSVGVRLQSNCITIRHLLACWCREPSLTRGRVCSLQLLLVLASNAILGSHVCETHDCTWYFTLPDSRFPNLEGQVPVFIFPRNRVAQLCPRALGSTHSELTPRPEEWQPQSGPIATVLLRLPRAVA
jgi:hypothetical protein